jgi:hypothetical protein
MSEAFHPRKALTLVARRCRDMIPEKSIDRDA